MNKVKTPDGLVHHHPKYGWYWPKLSADGYANLKSYGYEIKEVWLLTEPPVPKEVWGEIERLLDMLCDLKTWPEARWLIEKAWEIREAILPKQPKGEK